MTDRDVGFMILGGFIAMAAYVAVFALLGGFA